MNSETRICQNCHKEFTIESEDSAFYEKIKVPPPTFCPECRKQRRLTYRNERSLYKNNCKLCGKNTITMYYSDSYVKMYCQKCWWSDRWDPLEFGREYNFSEGFFNQFRLLYEQVPIVSLHNLNSINSEYCNHTYETKNCYLSFASDMNEDSGYLYHTIKSKDSYDLFGCKNQNLCYQNLYSHNCYKSLFTYFSDNCVDCAFLLNCNNCEHCFGCVNLRNAKYCIFNKRYSKEDYKKEMKKYNIGSFSGIEKIRNDFDVFIKMFPNKFVKSIRTINSIGDYLFDAKNSKYCFDIEGPIEDSKYIIYGIPNIKSSFDIYGTGAGVELCYEIFGCGSSLQNVAFSNSYDSHSIRYSISCYNSSYLFGCIGLRKKSYCILNKQYTKEEYEKLVPKIIEHMNQMPYIDKKGRVYKYGEFFPPELSPFCYNETIAQEYFPLTKEEALKQGYSWKEPEERNIQFSISNSQLPDNIKDVPDSIIGQVIECGHQGKCNEQCTTAFKIIEPELQFYRRMNLPLPRLCPNCRHYQRLKQRNPLKLWHRKCQCAGNQSENGVYKNTIKHFHGDSPCPNEFETTYAPERKEIVYCEKCYLSEVV